MERELDSVRESERAGKKEGAIAASAELPAETVPCGRCGAPLVAGATGSREPRGSYHIGCLRAARRETLEEPYRNAQEYGGQRRRRRGS